MRKIKEMKIRDVPEIGNLILYSPPSPAKRSVFSNSSTLHTFLAIFSVFVKKVAVGGDGSNMLFEEIAENSIYVALFVKY